MVLPRAPFGTPLTVENLKKYSMLRPQRPFPLPGSQIPPADPMDWSGMPYYYRDKETEDDWSSDRSESLFDQPYLFVSEQKRFEDPYCFGDDSDCPDDDGNDDDDYDHDDYDQ